MIYSDPDQDFVFFKLWYFKQTEFISNEVQWIQCHVKIQSLISSDPAVLTVFFILTTAILISNLMLIPDFRTALTENLNLFFFYRTPLYSQTRTSILWLGFQHSVFQKPTSLHCSYINTGNPLTPEIPGQCLRQSQVSS